MPERPFPSRSLKTLIPAALLLAGCAATPSRWWKDVSPAPPAIEKAWERHHWYVVDVKYTFRARAALEGAPRGPHAYAHLHLLVKALTPEGARIGALTIPAWNRDIHSMEVTLLDPEGRPVPVDQDRVRKAYERQGTVFVPRVAPGSMLAVHIVQGPYAALDAWEHTMAGSAPVWRSEFEFAHPMRMRYDYKAYNGLGPPERAERRQSTVLTWKTGAIPALPDLPFLDPAAARPRLLIVGRDASAGGYPDWRAVAARKQRQWLGRTARNRTAAARSLARDLTSRDTSDLARSRALLAWVQDHIVRSDDNPVEQDPDEVLEARRGNAWQVADLLEEMASSIGINTDIVLTRAQEEGGFDPSLPNPHAAAQPLVVLEAGGRDWVAWPYSRAYGLGDYPPGYFGLEALSLRKGAVRPLPEPTHAIASLSEVHAVRLPDSTAPTRRVFLELDGPYATLARSYWYDGAWTDTLAYCRAFLKAIGFPGLPRSCYETDLARRDLPLRLEVVPEEALSSVDSGRARQYFLPALLSNPAWFHDSSRTEAYHFPYEQTRRQTMVFETGPGARVELDAPCAEAD
ncbi:MAG TPA: transglutaminase-like domain-containing protein, partial [Fibrobacteria bacterium]|nr:transglutaminase-like domain-containing protein [Fibrobacteria bacterium]